MPTSRSPSTGRSSCIRKGWKKPPGILLQPVTKTLPATTWLCEANRFLRSGATTQDKDERYPENKKGTRPDVSFPTGHRSIVASEQSLRIGVLGCFLDVGAHLHGNDDVFALLG